MIFCINGRFIDEAEPAISLLDNGFLYGDGFYDTMHAYSGVLLEPDLHLERVLYSSQILDIPLPWTLREIRNWAEEIVKKNQLGDARVRVTVSRGAHGFDFHGSKNPTLTIVCEPMQDDPKIWEGVTAATMRLQRILPQIKTVGLMSMFVAYRRAEELGVYEMILLGEGDIVREGASTNVFCVRNDTLRTPKNQILEGLTRARVIALAQENGIPLRIEDFPMQELEASDEIFLTNRHREIIPVLQLNGKKIGKGSVGKHTLNFMQMYREYVRERTIGTKK